MLRFLKIKREYRKGVRMIKVMVVDDEVSIGDNLKIMLTEFKIIEASNCREAVEL